MSDAHSGLSIQEKEILTNVVNSSPFVAIWGRHKRCDYCKNYIMGVCTKALNTSSSPACKGFCMVDYLDAPSICRLCKYATMRDTCDDKDMKILIPYCMLDRENPIKIGLTSTACSNFKSCLEIEYKGSDNK